MVGRGLPGIFRRTPREWAVRGAVALAALSLGYISLVQALAIAVARSSPERAHALSPDDGKIAAEFARQLVVSEKTSSGDTPAVRIARGALVDEPIAPAALTVMAIKAQLHGDIAAARRLLTHSDALSRRDLGTRFLLIEDAVAREDVSGALRNYDIALRTSRGAFDTLFPVLTSAVADPAIMRPLADLLAKRPPWGEAFVRHIALNGPDPRVTTVLFNALLQRRVSIPDDIMVGLINTLATRGAVVDAWSFYQMVRGRSDLGASRDPAFAAQLVEPTVFDWTPVMNEAGINASIQRTAEGGFFEFSVPSSVGGIVLQQMQRLPPGRYRLEGQAVDMHQPAATRPYWALVCSDAREIGRVEFSEAGRAVGDFVVGSNCPAQLLRLIARASPEVGGVSGQIVRAELRPVGER